MHIHNVYFWLKDDQDAKSIAEFEEGLAWLAADPYAKSGYFGKPADTDRDVVETSYSYGLVLVFKDRAAHDKYQEGSAHMIFLDTNKEKWSKVVVYDIES